MKNYTQFKTTSEMQQNTISWSKNGFIAYALPSHTKNNLHLTYLENVDGKSWQLAKPQAISVKPNIDRSSAPELSLVCWSNLSTDLAIADVYGNFYVLLAGVGLVNEPPRTGNNADTSPSYELTSYNHLEMIYRDIISNNSSHKPNLEVQFVTFSWLPIEKNQIISREAKLGDNRESLYYGYGVEQYQPKNLCHPLSTKQACVALRTNGELILHYQGEHKVEYHKLSVQLNQEFNYDMHIDEASFGFPSNKKIVLVTHDSLSNKIRTYLITIDWGFLVEAAKKQKADPHYNTPVELQTKPTLTSILISETEPDIENEFDAVHYDDDFDNLIENDAMDIDSDKNVKLELASEAAKEYKPKQKISKISFIELISSYYDESEDMDILIGYESYDELFHISTTVKRYLVVESDRIILNAFEQIGKKKGSIEVSSTREYSLLYRDSCLIPQKVVNVDYTRSELIILCENGVVETISRQNTKMIEWKKKISATPSTLQVPESIRSLFDVNFCMPQLEINPKNHVMVAYSPNGIGAIYCELEDDKADLKLVFAKKNSEGISAEELYSTSVAFAFQHAFACYCNISSDDILVLMQLEVERISREVTKYVSDPIKQRSATDKFIESIICESHRAINFQLDIFSKESVDKLLSNPPLQKLLSLQLVLGNLDFRMNDISSNVAWIILNLRSTSFGIMFLLSSIYRQISKKKPTEDTLEDSITRAESIISLTGNVRWLVELIICLKQELLQLFMVRKNPANSRVNSSNSIALPILLSKVPRLFLMYALSSIGKTHEVLKKLNKDLLDSNKLFTPMKDALNRYFTACSNSPLNLNLYETFVRECDTYISTEMGNLAKNKPKGYVLKLEQKLVCNGTVDDDLTAIGQWVVTKHASFISRDLKVAEMFYYDVDWLDIGYKMFDNTYSGEAKDKPLNREDSSANFFRYSGEMIPRQVYKKHERVDALRKVFINVRDSDLQLRKCTRCRSISLVNDPLVFSKGTLGLWTMVFQRTCVCGSAWVNL